MLRAAAVGGGAYMAGKHNANRRAEQEQYQQDQDDRISNLEAQQAAVVPQAPPAPAPAPAAAPSPMIDQLNQLAALHQQGVLSDEEFAAAKAKLLGT